MNIIIEEFFLSPNLSSLTRIYQYSIYYLNIYQESQNIIKGQELKDQLGELSVNEIIPKGLFKDVYYRKLSRRQITRELDLLEVNPVIEKNNKNLKKNTIENKSEIYFEMKNVDIILPVEPNSFNTQVFFSKVHINCIMNSYSKVNNIYQKYQLVKQDYLNNDSELSFSITKGKMNIYNFKDNYIEISKFENLNFDNIIDDYAITLKLKSSLDHINKISNTRIDILTNPLKLIVNFIHISAFLKLFSNLNIYSNKFGQEYSSITTQKISRKKITEEGQISSELNKQKIKKILSNLDDYSLCQEINASISDINYDMCDYNNGQYKSLIHL